ncbi:ankyrin repeat domain-containing protein [Campylobacter geochelonis]|uniref:ankyrin repeat domain-containing protein n=1 Tax=Campylobacter geochelonis TaxID=1780362 RepID=UPI00155D9435|nr:ankyrin repeat domain-containing protein [Campylobacter geochelonis]QKF71372.1 ankyrin domain-containing protein [Campylobacter geochelonis]
MNQTSKNFIITIAVIFITILAYLYKTNQLPNLTNQTSHFTITSDTNVSAIPGLSKYVTQEEVDEFGFSYSDIHCDKETNSTLIPLRNALQEKDTYKVINFLKEHNLSADIKMVDGKTPIMYSSFYNDLNTTMELYKIGANLHIKDRYKLNALAYAISINSANTVKFLLDNNVTMQETPVVQMYGAGVASFYRQIDKIIINNYDMQIGYETGITLFKCGEGRYGDGLNPFLYIVYSNLYDTAKVVLESGYKPTECSWGSNKYAVDCYKKITEYDNYEPMLELMLKYNVPGQPTKEQLKEAYDECYEDRAWFLNGDYDDYIYNATRLNKIMEKEGMKIKQPISKIEYDSNKARTLRYYNKHCTDKNGTFKDTKAYIDYANESAKEYAVSRFLRINKNNPSKVIYLDKNSSKSNSNLTDKNKNKN